MATLATLIPIQELTPGMVGKIRNDVIQGVVALASKELSIPPTNLVVRDVRPFNDLGMYAGGTTAAAIDEWLYDATTTTANAFTSVSGAKTMGDQKFVALFGIRDLRRGVGVHTTAMDLVESTSIPVAATGENAFARGILPGAVVSLVKINVGGADKVIWDLTSMEAYQDMNVGFTQAPVLIPQNVSYNLYYYFKTTAAGLRAWLQFIGVVVEPRGLTISP